MAPRKQTGSAPAAPAPEVAPKVTPAAAPCGCGCGTDAKPGRSFLQGHDARFHGTLARALREGATEVVVNGSPVVISEEYARRGWKPAAPRVSRKLTPEQRVAKLTEQLAAAVAVAEASAV